MSFKLPDDLIRNMTDVFTIERDGQEVASAHGFFCGKEYPSTIQLVENTTVHEGDWLIHAPTKNRYFATEVQPISINGEIFDWMVKYQSEFDWKKSQANQAVSNIHIGTVSGPAIIGSQQNATLSVGCTTEEIARLITAKPTSDLPALCELVAELKKIESESGPIEKGRLSKFSDLLEKHSDLLIALGGWAVKLLTGN